MKNNHIKGYLIATILMLSMLPLLASYVLIDEVLNSAISLVMKDDTQQILQSYSSDLKRLKTFDPTNEQGYKKKFLQVSDELLIYQQPELLKGLLQETYLSYYLFLFVLVLAFSLAIAFFLSQKIARSYQKLALSDVSKAKKLQELSHFEQWQALAAKLAHEINNPLTPIEMMVSNLAKIHNKGDAELFKQNLTDTQIMVSEEVTKLKGMVSHFSRFAKLPEPQLQITHIFTYCQDFIRQHQGAWPSVTLTIIDSLKENRHVESDISVNMDKLLFNQCLINIINNAVQANSKLQQLDIKITLTLAQNNVHLVVFNSGKNIDANQCNKIFNLHYSSNEHHENMGLGLAIVRKIVLDHGGEINCLPKKNGAAFQINLPVIQPN